MTGGQDWAAEWIDTGGDMSEPKRMSDERMRRLRMWSDCGMRLGGEVGELMSHIAALEAAELAAAKAECERFRNCVSDALRLLEQAVIIEGDDAGVLLQSCKSTTHYDRATQCHVYDNEYFSSMGEWLVGVANKHIS